MTEPAASAPLYAAVPAQINLPAMEHEILKLWAERDTFERSIAEREGAKPFIFYEGPPTANGVPGTHHVEARVFKDVFPRFKTMQGYRCERKAGWDCHGLPVELAVEKELGFNGKPDIERYGIEAFNAKCRESVLRNVDAFTEMTDRMGYWVNLDEAYVTMTPQYVESVWWALKRIYDKGLLVEAQRVAPYCPRCGTTLSDHELAQGYEDTVDTTVFARFHLTSGPYAGQADLVIWTTTPWTLISNSLVAVGPDITYTVASKDGEVPVVVATDVVDSLLGDGWSTGDTFTGAEMNGWTYERPFDVLTQPGKAWFVVEEDYVTTDSGTGLVHQAMPFGEIDYQSCLRNGIAFVNPIQPDGHFAEGLGLVSGLFFKDADPVILADLAERGMSFRELKHEHSYPHCWRCATPLMYYAQPSWYIRTTAIKDQLLAENEATTWHPDTIKHGRYGDWLNNNVDWALSRTRYWGTPLPIWRNDLDPTNYVCVGSLAELGEYAGHDLSALDPHRPFVDDVTFTIDGVEGTFRRVPEVIDAWADSGSMPFAQWGYPWAEGSVEKFEQNFPADFICEAIDQTRGWFYTLMAMATLVFERNSYRNVLCLGHILAEDGRKMSKHLGNILLPMPLMDEHGADTVRWFMAASGSPWAARRVGHTALQEITRKVLLTYWNTVAFHALYARANHWSPGLDSLRSLGQREGASPDQRDGERSASEGAARDEAERSDQREGERSASEGAARDEAPALAERHVLDRWLVSVTNVLVGDVTAAMEGYDTLRAGTLLQQFIDDLSNWYVRRSRRRFWDGDPSALWTLHEVLDVLTRLLAPLVPFITERVWQDLFVATDPTRPDSVHLAAWPTVDQAAIDERLDDAMTTARRLVELGRSARAESRVKTRQPLARILVPSSALAQLDDELIAEIRSELNVGAVESFASAGDVVDYSAKGNFRALGKRFGKQTPTVAAAIAAADAAQLAADLAATGTATVGEWEVSAEEVLVNERPREGWSVVNEQGETVALDLELTPELVNAGLARDAIRFIQETRKGSGLEVSDRIVLLWHADGELADAIRAHAAEIAGEVLATTMTPAPVGAGWVSDAESGLAVLVSKA